MKCDILYQKRAIAGGFPWKAASEIEMTAESLIWCVLRILRRDVGLREKLGLGCSLNKGLRRSRRELCSWDKCFRFVCHCFAGARSLYLDIDQSFERGNDLEQGNLLQLRFPQRLVSCKDGCITVRYRTHGFPICCRAHSALHCS